MPNVNTPETKKVKLEWTHQGKRRRQHLKKNDRHVERGSSVVECRTRNQVSPGSNPSLLPFRRLGIFVLSIDSAV